MYEIDDEFQPLNDLESFILETRYKKVKEIERENLDNKLRSPRIGILSDHQPTPLSLKKRKSPSDEELIFDFGDKIVDLKNKRVRFTKQNTKETEEPE